MLFKHLNEEQINELINKKQTAREKPFRVIESKIQQMKEAENNDDTLISIHEYQEKQKKEEKDDKFKKELIDQTYNITRNQNEQIRNQETQQESLDDLFSVQEATNSKLDKITKKQMKTLMRLDPTFEFVKLAALDLKTLRRQIRGIFNPEIKKYDAIKLILQQRGRPEIERKHDVSESESEEEEQHGTGMKNEINKYAPKKNITKKMRLYNEAKLKGYNKSYTNSTIKRLENYLNHEVNKKETIKKLSAAAGNVDTTKKKIKKTYDLLIDAIKYENENKILKYGELLIKENFLTKNELLKMIDEYTVY
jgi:hypothetical protein